MSVEANRAVFDAMVMQTIDRRLQRLSGEELLDVLGFLIQMDRRKSADERPEGLYPIS